MHHAISIFSIIIMLLIAITSVFNVFAANMYILIHSVLLYVLWAIILCVILCCYHLDNSFVVKLMSFPRM